PRVAEEICKTAGVDSHAKPRNIMGETADKIYKAIQATKIMAPPTNCISPIGEKAILTGLYKQIKADFYTAVTRPPAVYRGNPFIIEAGLAFGRGPDAAQVVEKKAPMAEGEHKDEESELARVLRFANRVPLLYQQSGCCTYQAVLDTSWRNYGVSQSRGALPAGPMVIFVHMASVWVPFTSESKEAIADYDEIRKEIKLAMQECGRRLGIFLKRKEHAKHEHHRRNIFELYIEEVAQACKRLKGGKLAAEKLKGQLMKIAMKRTGGEKTDEILGKKGGPEGLPDSIIVTAEGVEGDVPVEIPPEGTPEPPQPTAPQPELPLEHAPKVEKPKATKATPSGRGRRQPSRGGGPRAAEPAAKKRKK
ncbi:MAG: DNA topoisomerase VI subunit B, partial [Elusimicrobia bacterium]|nr:DNA topoisomerase VI subunit B [Elusimicrobiota bacterium]